MSTQFDKELERILIDLRGWDIERPQAVEAIKKAVEVHIVGEDMKEYRPNAPFERNGIKMSPRGENQRIRNENGLRAAQRKHLYGEDK